MNTEEIWHYTAEAGSLIMTWTPTIVWAIITLIVWLRAIKWIAKIVNKWFETSKLDITVAKFLSNLISVWLKVLLLISVAGMFGVQTTSFIALLWAAWLAVGMALQWSLSNFAWWVLILLFKPYKIWDLVDLQWIKGHVMEIWILNTTLTTLDNNTAIVPNGPIINDNIINLTTKNSIRVDVKVGIAYHESIDNARKVINEAIQANTYIIDHQNNGIFVNDLGESSVQLIVRWYTKPETYRPAYFSLTEDTKNALEKAGIEIPFPQRVITSKK